MACHRKADGSSETAGEGETCEGSACEMASVGGGGDLVSECVRVGAVIGKFVV